MLPTPLSSLLKIVNFLGSSPMLLLTASFCISYPVLSKCTDHYNSVKSSFVQNLRISSSVQYKDKLLIQLESFSNTPLMPVVPAARRYQPFLFLNYNKHLLRKQLPLNHYTCSTGRKLTRTTRGTTPTPSPSVTS